MTDEAKESYMQDIKNILSGGIGVGSYQKDFLDEESELQWGDVDKRAEIFYDMLGDYNYPKLSYEEGEGVLGRSGSYKMGNFSDMIQGNVGEDQEIYVDPSAYNISMPQSGNTVQENRFASALGLPATELSYVGLTDAEQTLLAEMGHAQSFGEQSPASQKGAFGWNKVGTGGNLMALLENTMVGIGQGGVNIGAGLMPKKGHRDESTVGKLRYKLGKGLADAGAWMAGYTREGAEEYQAHEINEENLKEEYQRRIAGYN